MIIPALPGLPRRHQQFTPKTVETAVEREKLMFRIRAQIPVDLLKKHHAQVKTGLPGVAYVRQIRPAMACAAAGQAAAMNAHDPTAPSPQHPRWSRCRRQPALRQDPPCRIRSPSISPQAAWSGSIGPDGVGKSSLLSLIAGSRAIQPVGVQVLGGSMADARHRRRSLPPHRLHAARAGQKSSTFATLSVFENVDFFARLFGHDRQERERRIERTAAGHRAGPLSPTGRPASSPAA